MKKISPHFKVLLLLGILLGSAPLSASFVEEVYLPRAPYHGGLNAPVDFDRSVVCNLASRTLVEQKMQDDGIDISSVPLADFLQEVKDFSFVLFRTPLSTPQLRSITLEAFNVTP